MNELISVIIPVYNVERYLEQCIDSVLNQKYKNMEIILIDDGSTDRSGQMCDKYAKQDKRIKVIHKKNGGAASAKNAGLRVAKGEYLVFVDSDDYLEPDAYSYMLSVLCEQDADVIQCSFRNIFPDIKKDIVKLPKPNVFDTQEYLKRFLIDWTCGLLWNKMYRRELFYGIFFEEGHKIDDEFFTYQGILNAKKVIHMPKVVYNYRKRKSSVMISPEFQHEILLDKLDYLDKRRIQVASKFPELKQEFDYHFLSMLLIFSKDSAATEKSLRETQKLLKSYFREKDKCKIDWIMRKNLFMLRHSKVEKILKQKRGEDTAEVQIQYFE